MNQLLKRIFSPMLESLIELRSYSLPDRYNLPHRYNLPRRYKLPCGIILFMSLNLAVAPAVQAATGTVLSRPQSYALGLLGLTTLALSIYLFVVMFQPERF